MTHESKEDQMFTACCCAFQTSNSDKGSAGRLTAEEELAARTMSMANPMISYDARI
jgi:hypothetical protein